MFNLILADSYQYIRMKKSLLLATFSVATFFTVLPVFAKDPLPDRTIPAPFGVNLKPHNFSPTVLDQVHANGLDFCIVRKGFYWKDVEKKKGVYDFSDYDETMQHAKKHGLRIVGALFGSNSLYEDSKNGGIRSEEARKGYANFAAAMAKHYKDHDVLWEIWNEPNTKTFWRKDGKGNTPVFAEEYTALVKETVPAILKEVPDAFVMAGSVSNYWEPSYQWTESCFKLGMLKTGIRGWSVHPYGVKTPEEHAVGHQRTRELLVKYGAPEMAMLNTERGFAVKEGPNNEGWSGGSKERAREFQAWNFVRQFLIDQLHDIRVVIWYEWDGEKFGLSDDGGTRPVHKAAVTMFAQLDGYQVVRRLESNSKSDYVVLFENKKSGVRKLVAWTAPPMQGAPDEAKAHVATLEVTAPASFNGEVKSVNLNGEPGTAKASNGTIQLNLEGAPQYVTVPAGVELGKLTANISDAPTTTKPVTPTSGLDHQE